MNRERPLRVLFVDDEPATCKIGALHLEKAGYAVEVAANGAEAFVAAMGTPPDIIISDIMMPVMDGVELLGKIRGEKTLRDCYVILLTSKDRVRDVIEGFEAEADDYITKPFQLSEMLARVQAGARIKQTQDELRVANERLRGSLRQLAEVIGVAAHEMRGPVRMIDHYVALIGTEETPAGQIREVCTRYADALTDILDGLLDLSRIDMGEVVLSVEEVSLEEACGEIRRLFVPLASEKRIAFEVEAEGGGVFCDRQRLAEMLGVLAENTLLLSREESRLALRATVDGGEAVFRAFLEVPAVTVGEARALLALSLREENLPVTPGLQVGFAILHKLAVLHGGRRRRPDLRRAPARGRGAGPRLRPAATRRRDHRRRAGEDRRSRRRRDRVRVSDPRPLSPHRILYEDNHCLGVSKRAGDLVQADATGDVSLLEEAKAYVRIRYEKPGAVYLGLVHRLDRPVSGAILFARTSKAAARLSRQFRERAVEKIYLAVVEGAPPEAGGVLVHFVRGDERRRRVSVSRREGPGATRAELHYRVIEAAGRRSLLEVRIVTGVKHQIRAQLSAVGCPVVGDVKYDNRRPPARAEPLADGRALARPAARLAVSHPTKKAPLVLEAPLPEYWPWPGG